MTGESKFDCWQEQEMFFFYVPSWETEGFGPVWFPSVTAGEPIGGGGHSWPHV